jgi:hypothetical protein
MEVKQKKFFFYILIFFIILIGVISYYRFMIKYDYIVEYEGVCDPTMQNCFVGCDDDACTEVYFYSKAQKYAADLFAQCGNDVTDCEAANTCFQEDRHCSITYCDPKNDDNLCETPQK